MSEKTRYRFQLKKPVSWVSLSQSQFTCLSNCLGLQISRVSCVVAPVLVVCVYWLENVFVWFSRLLAVTLSWRLVIDIGRLVFSRTLGCTRPLPQCWCLVFHFSTLQACACSYWSCAQEPQGMPFCRNLCSVLRLWQLRFLVLCNYCRNCWLPGRTHACIWRQRQCHLSCYP